MESSKLWALRSWVDRYQFEHRKEILLLVELGRFLEYVALDLVQIVNPMYLVNTEVSKKSYVSKTKETKLTMIAQWPMLPKTRVRSSYFQFIEAVLRV